MSRTIGPGHYLQPFKSDNTPAAAAGAPGYYTLAAGPSTYYVEIGGSGATCLSAHLQWSAALAAVITVWTSDLGPLEAPLTSTTAGDWHQQNPSTAYVPVTGASNTVSNLTITAGGAAVGGAQVNFVGLGPSRVRLRIVVSTAGTMRIAYSGKA